MIDAEKRKAVYLLNQQGMGLREIARRFSVSINTVSAIIDQKGNMPDRTRKDKIRIDSDLLTRLYSECNGYIQRIYEKLMEEEKISVGYSTLSRIIREIGLGKSQQERCEQFPDRPGKEMQHDTSPYRIQLGERNVLVQASLLYYRYSKVRYLKFYRSFNRFQMKCFFHEALSFWGYCAEICIIDNTNLARLHGTGKDAVIAAEMEQFARQYGFRFVCHEKGHANRKAGEERGFFTAATNFFPGRKFADMEDLNRQAFDWACVRMANRPTGKTRQIPAAAFEYEKPYLTRLPVYVQPPYLVHERRTDQYGYASFDGNFYWVPGNKRDDVKLLQYSGCLKIYQQRQLLGEYDLPAQGVKNEKIYPRGQAKPRHQPRRRKRPTAQEEKVLRATAAEVDAYLNFALKTGGKPRHRFIRQLYGLHQKLAQPLFIKVIERALKYRITDAGTIDRMVLLVLTEDDFDPPSAQIDEQLKDRPSYLEGRFSDDVDLSIYDQSTEDNDE